MAGVGVADGKPEQLYRTVYHAYQWHNCRDTHRLEQPSLA
jgi:hypothetical protein